MVPPQVAQWVKRTYPKPQVDPVRSTLYTVVLPAEMALGVAGRMLLVDRV